MEANILEGYSKQIDAVLNVGDLVSDLRVRAENCSGVGGINVPTEQALKITDSHTILLATVRRMIGTLSAFEDKGIPVIEIGILQAIVGGTLAGMTVDDAFGLFVGEVPDLEEPEGPVQ
jgi:hypothetical protein